MLRHQNHVRGDSAPRRYPSGPCSFCPLISRTSQVLGSGNLRLNTGPRKASPCPVPGKQARPRGSLALGLRFTRIHSVQRLKPNTRSVGCRLTTLARPSSESRGGLSVPVTGAQGWEAIGTAFWILVALTKQPPEVLGRGSKHTWIQFP